MPPAPFTPPLRGPLTRLATVAAALCLGACASPGPTPANNTPPPPATSWQAPLPHGGQLADLTQWWQHQGDPLLAGLIAQAQAASPGVASALAQIGQARATLGQALATGRPQLDASTGNTGRARIRADLPPTSTVQAGLAASWELDVAGGHAASQDAARQRLAGAQALWHDARVSVAAEVATQYAALRACERQLALARADADSRATSARLAGIEAQAGLQAPASAALAQAGAAEGRSRVAQQQASCDLNIKALVALTAQDEAGLRQTLQPGTARQLQPASLQVAALPADVVSQRPDVANAAREVAAAAADLDATRAQRYPRLVVNGSVYATRNVTAGVVSTAPTWSLGPLALTLPLLDGGKLTAAVGAAQAHYTAAQAGYAARVRQAVREVEESLVQLASTGTRLQDAAEVTRGQAAALAAAQARWQHGLASQTELEDSRRSALAAESALAALEQERVNAWIALYRAAGGGWTAQADTP